MKKHLRLVMLSFAVYGAGFGSAKIPLHPQKHTWNCTLMAMRGHSYWFQRPNQEIFEMYFDNPPVIQPGIPLKDLTYTDDNGWMQHFVKYQFQ